MRKYHPWIEEINLCILLLEESGILTAWADKELKIDLFRNPNEKEASSNIRFSINMIKSMLLMLGIGLPLTIVAFLTEILAETKFISKFWKQLIFCQKMRHKYEVTNFILIIICGSLIWAYFQEQKFSAVICKWFQ